MTIRELVPPSVAIANRIVPVLDSKGTLVLATDSHLDSEEHDKLQFILNRRIRYILRTRDWVNAELEAHYRPFPEPSKGEVDSDDVKWFWPCLNRNDGCTLSIHTSGWRDSYHWSGETTFSADHPDREFWNWIINVPQYAKALLDERCVPKLKRVWSRYRKRCS